MQWEGAGFELMSAEVVADAIDRAAAIHRVVAAELAVAEKRRCVCERPNISHSVCASDRASPTARASDRASPTATSCRPPVNMPTDSARETDQATVDEHD